jgi:diadenosine tetraphosphate (Ap4A) HIT family hydrolase
MTAPRSRKHNRIYQKYLQQADPSICTFCTLKGDEIIVVGHTKYFTILKNRFPYTLWDGQTVTNHLMVVPKQHIASLSGLTLHEKAEYVDILEKYENDGYNIYARAPVSVIKSVLHQHTHLIKTTGGAKKLVFMIKKPYIRLTLG